VRLIARSEFDMMKNLAIKIVLFIILVPVLSIAGYLGYQSYLAPIPPTPTPTINPDESEITRAMVSAEGKVVPLQYVQLSFRTAGTVKEVFVKQGDRVEADHLLAILTGKEDLEAAIAAAQLELTNAQHDLDALYEHIELSRAQAQMDVVDAKDNVKEAERLINALDSTPSEDQVKAAESAVILAEKELETARRGLNQISNKPETSPQRAAAQLAVYAAERQYLKAVNYLNALGGTPSEQDVERAEANLALAEAQLAEAEQRYEVLKQGPDPDDVELAQARLDNAKAQLTAVQTRLQDLELRAPFSGEIVTQDLKPGEVVNPSIPQIVLADLSSWKIETTDMTEKDVVLLSPGMQAVITLNAFPESKFKGVISSIGQLGQELRGTVNYIVSLDFDYGDAPLRWEMTAFIDIMLPEDKGQP
jgi:HlyD family secretion protein